MEKKIGSDDNNCGLCVCVCVHSHARTDSGDAGRHTLVQWKNCRKNIVAAASSLSKHKLLLLSGPGCAGELKIIQRRQRGPAD